MTFHTEPIIVSHEQSKNFLNTLAHPDSNYITRRNAVFANMDNITLTREGTTITANIPNLNLSFLAQ